MKSHAIGIADDQELKRLIDKELTEFVNLGRKKYLNEKHLVRSAGSTFFIRWENTDCDLKAIWKAAVGAQSRTRVGTSGQIKRRLEELNYEVITLADRPVIDIPGNTSE